MALRVWLPLNGDLKNQGLENVTVTNNGATVSDDGKIGKCYSFNRNNLVLSRNINFNIISGCTFCAWVYITTNANKFFIASNSSGGPVNFGVGLDSSNKLIAYHYNNSWQSTYSTGTITINAWNHIAFCLKNSIVDFYINGTLAGSDSAGVSSSNGGIPINCVGGWNSSLNFSGKLNDIRYYDHCLSPQEVKEISKGLVLHYKLDDIPPVNLIPFELTPSNYTQINYGNRTSSNITNGIYHVDGYQESSSIDTSFAAISNSYITLSADTDYYLGFYCKCENDVDTFFGTSGQAYTGLRDDNNVTYYNTTYVTIGKQYEGWVVLKIHTGSATNYHIVLGFDGPNLYGIGSFMEFSKVILSTTKPRYFVPYNSTQIIYDCSGYGRNGTITGQSISINNISPRYNYNLLATNTSNWSIIRNSGFLLPDGPTTICFWSKPTVNTSENTSRVQIDFGYFQYFTYANYPYLIHNTDYKHKYVNYWSDGNWHFVTGVYDGTNLYIYVDGVNVSPATTTTTRDYQNDLIIRLMGNNFSDFRIYATALSEDDIKDLYQTSATVHNTGNIEAFEFIENESSLDITKTGLFEGENFIETYDYVYLPAGTSISSELNYDIGDTCKAETIIRYESGGSGRDLMGYSGSSQGYWGVKADGTWEPHGTFSYSNADITVKNNISYTHTSPTEHGIYKIGILGSSYSVRNKYIYHVKLYKNDVLERDLYPSKQNNVCGMMDVLTGTFYPASTNTAIVGNDDNIVASIYADKIEANQFIET